MLLDNRHGLVANVCVTAATGTAEREAAVVLLTPEARAKTVGGDKNFDVASFVAAVRARQITPHVAQKAHSAIDGRTTRHAGYEISQRKRKLIEQVFGWMKTVGGLFKADGVEAGKAPVLAGGLADRAARRRRDARDRALLVPGIEAVGLHADGNVEIEADLHAEPMRVRLAGGKLPVGIPLHKLDERDFGRVGSFAEPAQAASSGTRHSAGHSHQGVRTCGATPRSRQTRQQARRARRGISRSPRRSGAAFALKASNAARSARHFKSATAGVDNVALRAAAAEFGHRGHGVRPNSGMRFDIDIERVEEQPAVRRIRTGIAGPVVEQRMQRVEADAVGARSVRQLDQLSRSVKSPMPQLRAERTP